MLSSSPNPFSLHLHFNKPKSVTGNLIPLPVTVRLPRNFSGAATCATASPVTSLYEVLGISIGATNDEIKAAYRRLARSCHPDVASAGAGGRERKSVAEEFMRIYDAYSTLSDPEKRADYDRRIIRRNIPATTARPFAGISASPAASSFCRFPRRNWETDQCW